MTPLLPEATASEIREALYRGERIQAIQRHREATGLGLAEAKAAVDRMEAELRRTSPEKFTAPPRGAGCLGVGLLAGAVGLVVWGMA